MAGKVEIINMALTRLGLATIGSLGDPTPQARLAALEFDNARDCVLRDFHWGFAARSAAAPPLAVTPPDGWAYAYTYPPDCLLARKVLAGGGEARFAIGETDGRTVILANACPVTLHYTATVANPERFDPLFTDALAWRLAVPLATGIAADPGKAQTANAMYEAALSRARARDAAEEETAEPRVSSYEAGRR